MGMILLIACAIAPAIALMSYFYIRDLYDAEPLKLVGLLFLVGMLSAIPDMYIVTFTKPFLGSPFAHSYLAVAVVEELSKFALTVWLAVRHREFDEEYDGIVYAVACSLGFATVENILKALSFGWETVAFRALFAVPGHALFGVIMGYYLGKAKFTASRKKRKLFYASAFFYPWLLHGTYDSLLLSDKTLYAALIVPLLIWMWIFGLRKMRNAQENSPFKPLEEQARDV